MVEAFFPLPSYIRRSRWKASVHFRAIHANSNAFTWPDKIVRVFS